MSGVAKIIDAILKYPGRITLALFAWSLVSIVVFSEPIENWPSTLIPQRIVALIFILLAWLTGLLLLTKALNWLSSPLSRSLANTARIVGRRAELAKLSLEARAALKAVSESGFSWFHGEPHEGYVIELRANGFVRVDVAGEGWGHYDLTSKALNVVKTDFQHYHALLAVPEDVAAKICASMLYAERVAKSLARPRGARTPG